MLMSMVADEPGNNDTKLQSIPNFNLSVEHRISSLNNYNPSLQVAKASEGVKLGRSSPHNLFVHWSGSPRALCIGRLSWQTEREELQPQWIAVPYCA
jgi:hypothetical protein